MRLVLFYGTNRTTLENYYVLGSGVGRKTTSIRNQLSKRAVVNSKYLTTNVYPNLYNK